MPPVNWGSLMVQLSALGLTNAARDAQRYAVEADKRERDELRKQAERDREERARETARRDRENAERESASREREARAARQAAEEATWKRGRSLLAQGTVTEAKAVALVDTGVEAVLHSGIRAFVPTQALDEPPPASPKDKVRVGDTLHCKVILIDDQHRVVFLGVKRALEKWEAASAVSWREAGKRFPPGAPASGLVVAITDQGAIVSLNRYVRGVIPTSEVPATSSPRVEIGARLSCVVSRLDVAKRSMVLTMQTASLRR